MSIEEARAPDFFLAFELGTETSEKSPVILSLPKDLRGGGQGKRDCR